MGSAAAVRWHFSDAVAPDRAARLLSWQSFDEIIEGVSTCAIAPLYWEDATAPWLEGCKRASFELKVRPDVYDGFFNSPVGYRGQFARSERHGEATNRRLLAALLPRLIEVSAAHPTASRECVVASLQGGQAKVWIDETEVLDQLADATPHIVFPPWEFNEPDGPGLRAPRGTKLGAKGGWVSLTGTEVINTAKDGRSGHINRTGDSK
jgi:hypothetical protein